MPENIITNPLGAYGYATPVLGRVTEPVRNADTTDITAGDCVVFSYSTTTGEWTVTKSATGTSLFLKFGIAAEAIKVGRVGKIVTHGFCYANVGSNTVAAGDALQRSGATAAICTSLVPDATTIAGNCMGTVLAAKGSAAPYPFTNAAPVYLEKF